MNDWLSQPDDGNYLALDEPPMPDAPPAPPQPPAPQGGWLGASSSDGDHGGPFGEAPSQYHASAPAHGSAMADPRAQQAPPAPPPPPRAQPAYPSTFHPAAQPAQQPPPGYEPMALTVGPPALPDVTPTSQIVGGSRGHLSSLVLDVEVQVEVGLGNAALTVEEFLEMGRGSVVELDTPVDAPIELKVRGKVIARGQLVSINGSYGMRILEMLGEE